MGLFKKLASKQQRKEITSFITMLDTINNNLGLAILLLMAYHVKCNMTKTGISNIEIFNKMDTPINKQNNLDHKLHLEICELIRKLRGVIFSEYTQDDIKLATKVWLHSLRGILNPELQPLCKAMWDKLRDGIPRISEAIVYLKNEGAVLDSQCLLLAEESKTYR